jgi:hypothetical protein
VQDGQACGGVGLARGERKAAGYSGALAEEEPGGAAAHAVVMAGVLPQGRRHSTKVMLPCLWMVATGSASTVASGGAARQRGRLERGESRDRHKRCEWRKRK